MSANAQFVDTALGNYQLLPNSTMIDAADPATALTSDLQGTGRPIDGDNNGSAIADLGALEFNPSSNRWPIADAGPDRVATSGLPITFDASGSVDPDGTIATYAWDFGDGTTGTGLTVTHTFTGGTDRTVTLTVTDNAGAVDVDTTFVEVNLPPIAEAGPPKFGDPGEIISFTAAGSSDSDGTIVTYAWDFGDGTSASGQSVSHQYGAGGTYTVTLTITDDDGAVATDTTTVNISGNDAVPPSIAHTPVTNGQSAGQAVTVSANITDASGVANANLYYRAIGGTAFTTATMSNTAGATWSGTVPAAAVTAPGVEYYIGATDNATPANSGTAPNGAPGAYFTFTVTAPAAPVITHTPVGNGQPQGQAVTVTADIASQAGLTSATLHYRVQGGGAFSTVTLTNTTGSTYQAQIPGAAVAPPTMEYYLEATDGAGQTTTHPTGGGVHGFTVTPSDTSPPAITHVPVANGQPAGQAVAITADVTDASGVGQVSLHYRVTGGGTFATVAMTAAGNTYSASIPAGTVTTAGVQYYISASDSAAPPNSGTSPAGAPTSVYSFTVQRVFNVSPGDLVISEIMADPSGTETGPRVVRGLQHHRRRHRPRRLHLHRRRGRRLHREQRGAAHRGERRLPGVRPQRGSRRQRRRDGGLRVHRDGPRQLHRRARHRRWRGPGRSGGLRRGRHLPPHPRPLGEPGPPRPRRHRQRRRRELVRRHHRFARRRLRHPGGRERQLSGHHPAGGGAQPDRERSAS
ncbi:MAG: PKD domain-containing protein [Deltaproteobacteria bacterium]|nr:PKD domain-containing protein [Deltaproteobacteria bacterium]